MLNLSTVQVSQLLKAARQATGKPLLTKGYYFDQGMRPTHKHEIIALYEAGLDEADIARQSQHEPSSVGGYIRDYERVKLLLRRYRKTRDILSQRNSRRKIRTLVPSAKSHPTLSQRFAKQ